MRLLQKANRQIRVVDDTRAEELLNAGYVELNPETGIPLKSADPEKDLKKENAALKKENKALHEQLANLTAKPESEKK